MVDDIAGQLLGLEERASWCGDTDPTGRYVCQRIRNHALDWHECLNDKGGRHMWKVAVDPVDLPFGALLRDPKSGRWAVRFQVDDTSGKGMHAWLVPPTIDHPEVRVLHHVEVRGWQPFEIILDQVNRLEGERDGILTQLVRLAKEFERVRASREAWAVEADRLDVIATAARYYAQPDTCDGSDCDHDDEVCVHMDELHATADDAGAARQVPWLQAERERLLTICAKGNDFVLAVAEALGMPASTSNDDLIAGLARLTRERDEALADAAGNEASLDTVTRRLAEALNLDEVPLDEMLFMVGNIVDERHGSVIRSAVAALESAPEQALASRPAIPADAVVLPDNWETQIRQALHARAHDISEAGPLPGTSSHDRDAERCADEIAGDVVVLINDWMSAPVSGSDTTADGAGR